MAEAKAHFTVREFDMPPLVGMASVHRVEFNYVCPGPHPWLSELWQGQNVISVHVDDATPETWRKAAESIAVGVEEHLAEHERNTVPL